jgi:hypothetical protein
MKKTKSQKLALPTQTIRVLTGTALEHVAGGNSVSCANCQPAVPGLIMKDTIIIRTSTR